MASTHITLGMGCWIAYSNMKGIPIQPLALGIAAIGSLLPDIDHPKSKFGRAVPFLSYPISMIFGHRGITHSVLAAVVSAIILYFYGAATWFVAPLIVGYLSHVAGDVFTNSGAPLLWPNKRKFSVPLFNTGGFLEFVFLTLLLTFVIWMVLKNAQYQNIWHWLIQR